MEAFFVVVVAVSILGVGVIAVLALRRIRSTMDPTDHPTGHPAEPQER
jgi:hypothetical protein